MALRPYQHADEMAPLLLPGLPATSRVKGDKLGSTKTQIGGQMPRTISVAGQPSMTVIPLRNGGVAVDLVRLSQYTEYLTDAELRPAERILGRAQRTAEAMSQGNLSLKQLAARGHPYGRGGRRGGLGRLQGSRAGVSNMAITNKQSGEFASSWESDMTRSKGRVVFRLYNTADHAKYPLLGTRTMKAHGPLTSAMIQHLAEFNTEWQRLAVVGYQRKLMIDRMGSASGSNA